MKSLSLNKDQIILFYLRIEAGGVVNLPSGVKRLRGELIILLKWKNTWLPNSTNKFIWELMNAFLLILVKHYYSEFLVQNKQWDI